MMRMVVAAFLGELAQRREDLLAVADAEPDGDGVADEAADGEGDHELAAGHLERAGGEDEGAERHGRREDGGEGDGEDGVVLHPAGDASEDARRDVLFDEVPCRRTWPTR